MTTPARPGYSTVATTTTTRLPSQPAEVEGLYTLEDVDPVGRMEAIIVGGPGSGKTVLASGFPAPFRWMATDGKTCVKPLHWAIRAGLSSIKDKGKDIVLYTPSESIDDRSRYASKPSAFNRMTDMIDYWFSPGQVEQWVGGTLVIDSASQANEWAMNLALEANNIYPDPKKPLSTSHDTNKKARLKMLTGLQDYKSAGAVFEGWINDVRVLCAQHNRNLVLLAHEWENDERDDKKGIRKIISVQPWFYGQLRVSLPKAFDDVWYMEVYNGTDFKVQMKRSSKKEAKTRWGAFMNKTEPANFKYLIGKVQDYQTMPDVAFKKKYGVQVAPVEVKPKEEKEDE